MSQKTIKQSQRDFEKLIFKRDMFWHEPTKQQLIERLLQKIYDLEDKIELLSSNKTKK